MSHTSWRCCCCCCGTACSPRASSSSGRDGVRLLSGEHRCAKPLEYPFAGKPRTNHRGGLSLFSCHKGKSHGESMAVEEEGLRVFQSVKIKIGKKKIPYPQSKRFSGYGSILTGQIDTEGWRLDLI